jgi:hypothetical protein
MIQLLPKDESWVKGYLKLGFGGAHSESNPRLMYSLACFQQICLLWRDSVHARLKGRMVRAL